MQVLGGVPSSQEFIGASLRTCVLWVVGGGRDVGIILGRTWGCKEVERGRGIRFSILWVECAPSCTFVGGGWGKGTQTNIERDSGSIQRFMYSGGA